MYRIKVLLSEKNIFIYLFLDIVISNTNDFAYAVFSQLSLKSKALRSSASFIVSMLDYIQNM